MDRTLIVFDMDTNCLKQHYHNPSWNNAYADIWRILNRHGFDNIQGTVYLSKEGIRQAHGTLALQEVAARFEWFHACASNIQFYELKDDFNAQFIVDSVHAARESFKRSLEELKRDLKNAGLDDKTIESILSKREFTLQYAQDNQLLPNKIPEK